MITSELTAAEMASSRSNDFYFGLALACSSSVFIGSSFVFKKKGLLKLALMGKRAGDGGYGYLKEPLWWAGFLLMTSGEAANFTAYAFAPASLVTPLGALSVLVAAVLSSHFLGERLNLISKVGCALSLLGSTVFVLHAPKEQEVATLSELVPLLREPGFIVYVCFVIAISLVLIFYCERRWGRSNVFVYVVTCSAVGSLSVMGCKGIGVGLKQTFSGDSQLTYWLFWVMLLQLAGCLAVQLVYLNRALDTFNTSVVTPIYYVLFTTFVIAASAVLYKEWGGMAAIDIVGAFCGFLIVVGGIFLLHAFKDLDASVRNLPSMRRGASATTDLAAPLLPTPGEDGDEDVVVDCSRGYA